MTKTEPEWLDCTVAQWEKKAEIASKNGNLGKALMFADYANCRELYDNGTDIETVQGRFG